MKVKIKQKGPGCNLEIGKVYNICKTSAIVLINNGQAEEVTDKTTVTAPPHARPKKEDNDKK